MSADMLAAAAAAENERRAANAEKTSIIINFVVDRLRFIVSKIKSVFRPAHSAPTFKALF